MLDLIWQLYQQGKIDSSARINKLQDEKIKASRYKSDSLEERLSDLEQKHEQLKMFTLALWSLLRDHSGLMESDIKKYMEKIDLLDGKLDGKVTLSPEVVECLACSRKLMDTAKVCPYCGEKNAKYRIYKGL